MNTVPKPKRLTRREFAARAGVSVDTVRRWEAAGYLKPVRNPPNPRRKAGTEEGWSRVYFLETELEKITRPRRPAADPGDVPPLPIRLRKSKLQKVRELLQTVDFSDLAS